VAVAAFPLMLPVIVPDTVRDERVPTLVRDDARTFAANVAPVSVPAAAVTVMFPLPSNETPLIVRAVCKTVALPAFPVTEPEIGFVTVRLTRVPTEVSEELTTPAASVFPLNTPAGAVDTWGFGYVPDRSPPAGPDGGPPPAAGLLAMSHESIVSIASSCAAESDAVKHLAAIASALGSQSTAIRLSV